jgi:hypothetical protein
MGTDKLAFEWEQWEATGSDVSHVTGSDPVRTILCACATEICAIVGLFDRKWQSHVTGRGPVWKWPWQEVGSAHARLFSRVLFLSSSTIATEGYLIPSGFPLSVRNRKLRNIRSDRRSRDPVGSVLGVFSTTSASHDPREPRVLYLVTGTSPCYLPLLFSYSV